jgi:hypothetical protein
MKRHRRARSPLYPKVLFGFTDHPITVWAGVIVLRLYFEWIKLGKELSEALAAFTRVGSPAQAQSQTVRRDHNSCDRYRSLLTPD